MRRTEVRAFKVLVLLLAMRSHAWAAETLVLPTTLATFLQTGVWDKTPSGFRIITLSFIADGCVAEAKADPGKKAAALACVDRILALARATRPKGLDIAKAEAGVWLGHYALILGARDSLADCADAEEHARIAEALAARAAREPTHNVPSFPQSQLRYPADHSAVLASLKRYDEAHGATLAVQPTALFIAYLAAKATDVGTGLPFSELSGSRNGRLPRGCALSWTVRYMAEVDGTYAAELWAAYKRQYLVDVVALVGFREWPPGISRPADIDSGPIVHDVGAAATALALSAARVMGDTTLALRLEATANAVTAYAERDPAMSRHVHTLLAESIRYVGRP